MNQTWLVTAFFFALFSLILYGAFLILMPFLTAITWAVILTILVYPLYAWLLQRMRGRASLAALTVIAVIALLVIAPGIELARFLSEETILVVQSLRSLLEEEGKQEWLAKPWLQQLVSWWYLVSFRLTDFNIDWKAMLAQGAQASSKVLVDQVRGIAQNVLVFTVNVIVALITLFFLLRDGKEFIRRLQRLLPMDREHQQRLFKNIVDAVLAVVHGSFVVAMVQGLLAGLAYYFLGVPFAVLWGVLTGFFALLPVGGSTLVSIPATIYLFLQGETIRAFALLGWSLGIVGTVDNILKPLLIGNRLGLPVLFLFFGILGGLALFGAIGIILGPVIFALLRALLDLYSEEYRQENESKITLE
ncbi:MAG TPA: AI-2E family transporter [Candidatus Binatia bacterium]|nr:AI-2E family transporter [Candidatus Binatia bacterium]